MTRSETTKDFRVYGLEFRVQGLVCGVVPVDSCGYSDGYFIGLSSTPPSYNKIPMISLIVLS